MTLERRDNEIDGYVGNPRSTNRLIRGNVVYEVDSRGRETGVAAVAEDFWAYANDGSESRMIGPATYTRGEN